MIRKRPGRNRQSRIAHVESLLVPKSVPPPDPQSNEAWLAQFQQWAREGLYQGRYGFQLMLQRYERAITVSKSSNDPPYHPPSDFEPRLQPAVRLSMWQDQGRFPELHDSLTELLLLTKQAMEER